MWSSFDIVSDLIGQTILDEVIVEKFSRVSLLLSVTSFVKFISSAPPPINMSKMSEIILKN